MDSTRYQRLPRTLFGADTLDDQRLADAVLALGFVDRATLAAGRDGEERLAQRLLREGQLDAAQLLEALAWLDDGEPRAEDRAASGPPTVGRYRLLRRIARGGMGTVHEAYDPRLRRRVALKLLHADGDGAPLERFVREAQVVAGLRHPNIVAVHEVGSAPSTDGERHFIAMELVEGATLADHLRTRSTDLRALVGMLETVARAVAFAHAAGVVHRDLKPANVLVEEPGMRVLLTDFGLARAESFETQLTHSQAVMGTPCYMAPEQATGDVAAIGPHTDVYALGAMLYQLLTGAPPFHDAPPHGLDRRILHDDPPRPRRRRPGAPAALEAVCLRALEKAPARRYPSATAFADELRRWLDDQPVEARPPGRLRRLARRVRRNPAAWLAGALALAALLGGAGVTATLQARRARERAARRIYREARADHTRALLALGAGDRTTADRRFAGFERRLALARRLDPTFGGGWVERAQYLRLTGDVAAALRATERGLARDPDHIEGRLEHGLLLAAGYRRALAEAQLRADATRDVRFGVRPTVDRLEQRDPQLKAQRERARRALTEAAPGDDAHAPPALRLARAELALLGGDLDRARRLAAGLELAEAKLLVGRVALRRGRPDEAERWITRALHTRRSCWDAWAARAALRLQRWRRTWRPGGEAGLAQAQGAVDDWQTVIAGRPDDAAARMGHATACRAVGLIALYRQRDPRAPFRAGLASVDWVLARQPRHVGALQLAQDLHAFLALAREGRGEDPTDDLEAAVRLGRVLLDGRRPAPHVQLAHARDLTRLAIARERRGIDASALRRDAGRSYRAVARRSAAAWEQAYYRGLALSTEGRWAEALTALREARRRGGDAVASRVEPYIKALEARRDR